MTSLDDVFEQMRLFQQALAEFNEEVRVSAESLGKAHDEVSGLWRDAAAARYQQAYEPLAHSLDEYLRAGAPQFERFIETKVRQLERYLHGA
jgi:predicted metal-dependent hydrolase